MEQTRIDLRGMIKLGEVEDLLTSLLRRIELQEREIASLHVKCARFADLSYLEEQIANLHDQLRLANMNLSKIEEYSTAAVGNGDRLPAGELSLLNSLQIQSVTRRLEDFSLKAHVAEELESIRIKHNLDIASIHNWAAPLTLAVHLEESLGTVTEKVDAVEMLLASKMDKSDFKKLELLISKLEHFGRFIDLTMKDLHSLQESRNELQMNLRKQSETTEEISQKLNLLRAAQEKCAQKSDLRVIAVEIETQSVLLSQCASKGFVSELASQHETTSESLGRLKDKLVILEKVASELQRSLTLKASQEDVNKRLSISRYDAECAKLLSRIDLLATEADLLSANEHVERLHEKLEEESVRIALAVRFVDWFTSRGVSYEHNIRIIDKHLEKLSSSAHPQNRSPFHNLMEISANPVQSPTPETAFQPKI